MNILSPQLSTLSRSFIYDVLYRVQILASVLKVAREELLPATFQHFGWDKYLLCPPVDNPRNLIDLVLTGRSYQV